MITAIDTNILFDILLPNPDFCDAAVRALEGSAVAGSLVICDWVYAELFHFVVQEEGYDFLAASEIRVESFVGPG